jgi:lipid-binding SYLF domain-containing protein
MIKARSVWIATALLTTAVVFVSANSLLAQGQDLIPKNLEEYADRAQESAEVLTEIMNIPEGGIPQELMERAHAVAVIPHVVKGAFGIGGRYGKGLVSQRQKDGKWGPPAYIEIGGGSVGFQIGIEATDLVLVFTNDDGVKGLLKGKVTLGADASVAAGPVGRGAEVGTDVLLRSAILSYSRSKGLFAGVALSGAALTIDDSANRKVYGEKVSGEDIVLGRSVTTTPVTKPFVDALERYSPKMRQSSGE